MKDIYEREQSVYEDLENINVNMNISISRKETRYYSAC